MDEKQFVLAHHGDIHDGSKWQDSEGSQKRFYLVNKVSSKWKMFGYRFDREPDE